MATPTQKVRVQATGRWHPFSLSLAFTPNNKASLHSSLTAKFCWTDRSSQSHWSHSTVQRRPTQPGVGAGVPTIPAARGSGSQTDDFTMGNFDFSLFMFMTCALIFTTEARNTFNHETNCNMQKMKTYFPSNKSIQYQSSNLLHILHETLMDEDYLSSISLNQTGSTFLAETPAQCLQVGAFYNISEAQLYHTGCTFASTILTADGHFNFHCKHNEKLITFAACRILIKAVATLTSKQYVDPLPAGLQILTVNSTHWYFVPFEHKIEQGCRCQTSVDLSLISSLRKENRKLVNEILFILQKYEAPTLKHFQVSYVTIRKPVKFPDQKIFYKYLCQYFGMVPCYFPSRDLSSNAISPSEQVGYEKILKIYFLLADTDIKRSKRAFFSFLETQNQADISEIEYLSQTNQYNLNKLLLMKREDRNSQTAIQKSLDLQKVTASSHNAYLQKLSSYLVLNNLNIHNLEKINSYKSYIQMIQNSLVQNQKSITKHLHYLMPFSLLSCTFKNEVYCGNHTRLLYNRKDGNFYLQQMNMRYQLMDSVAFTCLPLFQNDSFTLSPLHMKQYKLNEINITSLENYETCEDDDPDLTCNMTITTPASYANEKVHFYYVPAQGGFYFNTNFSFYLLDKHSKPYFLNPDKAVFISSQVFPLQHDHKMINLQDLINNFNNYRNKTIYGLPSRSFHKVNIDSGIDKNVFHQISKSNVDFQISTYLDKPMKKWKGTQKFYFYSAISLFVLLGLGIILGITKFFCCLKHCVCKGS